LKRNDNDGLWLSPAECRQCCKVLMARSGAKASFKKGVFFGWIDEVHLAGLQQSKIDI